MLSNFFSKLLLSPAFIFFNLIGLVTIIANFDNGAGLLALVLGLFNLAMIFRVVFKQMDEEYENRKKLWATLGGETF